MRTFMVLGFLLAFCFIAPPVTAQTPAPGAAPAVDSGMFGMTRGQLVAIAAGAVAGSVVIHAVLPGEVSYLLGGVAGGLLADWWYNNGGAQTIQESIVYMPRNPASQVTAQAMQVRLTR